MKDYFTKKEQVVILIVTLVVILSLSFKSIIPNLFKTNTQGVELIHADLDEDFDIDSNISSENSIIMVHISGQVYYPGLIELESGSRVKDAVELAGGLKKDADIDRINLAKKVLDEEKIYIPQKGEEFDIQINGSATTEVSGGKVNINSCTKEQLMSLPGIGDVTATKILDYRDKDKFKKIEDIMNVSGIGNKKFDAIKELISVN